MLPIKDNIPTRGFPIVTLALILANVLMLIFFQHATVSSHGVQVDQGNVVRFALIPYRLTHPGKDCGDTALLSGDRQPMASQTPVCEGQTVQDPTTGAQERVIRVAPHNEPPAIVTIFTAMFMHGGLLHIAGNMLFLWIFGNNIEDAMGRLSFLGFYLVGGVVAALAQTAIGPSSSVPTLGASGAIAAVLGAYALLYPRARVLTVIFIVFFFTVVELPALLVLGLWFGLQLLDSQFLGRDRRRRRLLRPHRRVPLRPARRTAPREALPEGLPARPPAAPVY